MTYNIAVRLPDDLADLLAQKAVTTGLSRNEVIQRALEAFLAPAKPRAVSKGLQRQSGTQVAAKKLQKAVSDVIDVPEDRLTAAQAIVAKNIKSKPAEEPEVHADPLKSAGEIDAMTKEQWEAYIAPSVPAQEPKRGAASLGPDGDAWV